MASKEWVKNELSLSDDCLTTTDRIMLNKVLEDLERLEKLEKTIEILKNKLVVFKQGDYLMSFNDHFEEQEITKEEYEILKEVLENE